MLDLTSGFAGTSSKINTSDTNALTSLPPTGWSCENCSHLARARGISQQVATAKSLRTSRTARMPKRSTPGDFARRFPSDIVLVPRIERETVTASTPPPQSQTWNEGPSAGRLPNRRARWRTGGCRRENHECRRRHSRTLQGTARRASGTVHHFADRCRRAHAIPTRSFGRSPQALGGCDQQDRVLSGSDHSGHGADWRLLDAKRTTPAGGDASLGGALNCRAYRPRPTGRLADLGPQHRKGSQPEGTVA